MQLQTTKSQQSNTVLHACLVSCERLSMSFQHMATDDENISKQLFREKQFPTVDTPNG